MTTTTPGRPARNALAFVVVASCIGFVGWGIAKDIDQVDLADLDWGAAARASVVLAVAYVFRALSFGVVVKSMDRAAPLWTSARVFLGAQLGRYVPGKIWQVAGAGYLASRFGTSATASVVGTTYYVVVHNLVGALLGLWVVVQRFPETAESDATWVLLIAGVLAVGFASSPAFARLVRWAGTKVGKELDFHAVPVWVAPLTILSSLVVWSLFGVAVVEVFGATVPLEAPPPLEAAITHMAAASVAGLAVLIAPSGLGVREAVFVAAFSDRYSVAVAGLVALVLRLLMSVLEAFLSALSIALPAKKHVAG
ncbi:MAG: lysylphosphatidylglycerol synthase domain-containing protein [Myxococcota bacterium]